jgi:hypothetical protein
MLQLLLTWLSDPEHLVLACTSAFTVAGLVVKFTPTKKDDEALAWLLRLFERMTTKRTPAVVSSKLSDAEVTALLDAIGRSAQGDADAVADALSKALDERR